MGVIAFANTPDEPTNADRLALDPTFPDKDRAGPVSAEGFRGIFYNSTPEASIPRTSLIADALWRVSDTTIVLSDFAWNIDKQSLATVSGGLLVGRGDRASYYTGVRYIGQLDSTIASFTANYQLTSKYSINLAASVDLAETDSKGGSLTVVRRFDRFSLAVRSYYDATEDEGGVEFAVYPEGLGAGLGTSQLSALGQR
jgi:hypothetical protein